MKDTDAGTLTGRLPKAELHLHLEGAIPPSTVCELAQRHGFSLTEDEVTSRYRYRDFRGFLDAFKWVTSFLQGPEDYALVTRRVVESLRAHHVVYAEVTLSIGVMLLHKQDVEANFNAICRAAESSENLALRWIFDAARQFGSKAAMEVAGLAARMKSCGVVAFGMGGDELALPASEFRGAYEHAAAEGLHCLAHAGEIGGPQSIREAVELLGAERIGHGIATIQDPALMDLLAERRIPLEICPTSNLRTGALARQLGTPEAHIRDHPLPRFLQRGVRVALSTDDPALFETNLSREYEVCREMGLDDSQIVRLAEESFEAAFLSETEKRLLLPLVRHKNQSLVAGQH
jgi:aminodeoxyfutalosine deaminase